MERGAGTIARSKDSTCCTAAGAKSLRVLTKTNSQRVFFFFFESTDYLKKDIFVIIEDLRNKVTLVNLGNTEIIIK